MNMTKVTPVRFMTITAGLVILVVSTGCIRPEIWPDYKPTFHETALEEVLLSGPQKINPLPAQRVPAPVSTKTPLNLSLDQALVMALAASSDIRVEKYNPILAGLSEQIEQGKFDPELFSQLRFDRDRTREMSPNTGNWVENGEQNHNALIGVSKTFPSGTNVEINASHRIDNPFQEPEEQKLRMGMTVTQALLRGHGSLVNLASIRQARLNTTATIYELRGIVEALLADTETAYWDHVLAQQEIGIVDNSLNIAKKQLSEVEQSIEIGTLPLIESANAKVEVALREQALINARSRFEENRLRLLFYIRQGNVGHYDLDIKATSTAVSEPDMMVEPEEHLLLADQSRSDLQEARLRVKQNRLEIVKTRNGILPRLDLFISLGKTGYANSFTDSFRAMNDSTYDFSAGIRFRQPLGNRIARARDRAARVTLEQAQEALENMRQIIQRDVRIALNELDRVRQQIFATRVTRMHQEKAMKAEQERFEAGTSTGLLVAQAQRDLLASHILEKQTIINYQKALVGLYLAEGSLLERRGVHMASFLSEPFQ